VEAVEEEVLVEDFINTLHTNILYIKTVKSTTAVVIMAVMLVKI
jgi:hypothetical protein